MKLNEIKEAVKSGKKVYWKQKNYQVIKAESGWLVVCLDNNYCTGLTKKDGVTMNDDEQDFYIGKD